MLLECAAIVGLVKGACQFSACRDRAFCMEVDRKACPLSLYEPLSVRINSLDLGSTSGVRCRESLVRATMEWLNIIFPRYFTSIYHERNGGSSS